MSFLSTRKFWIVLAAFLTLQAGIMYIAVRQSLRYGANYPQRSMVSQIETDLNQGKKPDDLMQGYIDMSRNMAPFIIIYDQYGKVVAGNGYLDNQIPQVPIDVLSAAKNNNIHQVTWEPKKGVRIASVSVQAGDYYALGGRSLEDTEQHIKRFGQWLFVFLAMSLAATFMGYYWTRRRTKHSEAPKDTLEKL